MIIPIKPIATTDKVISVSGKVFYNDRRRRIDVKKPIRDLFENSKLDVFYIMEICMSENKAIERVKELAEKNITPVIMYFVVRGGECNATEQMPRM